MSPSTDPCIPDASHVENQVLKESGKEDSKEQWDDIELSEGDNQDDKNHEGDWEIVETADTKQAEMTLPCQSPYVEEKEWEEVKVLQRQTQSKIDKEDWEITSFGGRKEKNVLLQRLREAEEAIAEELANFVLQCKNFVMRSDEEEEIFNGLDERKEAIRRAREIVDASMDE